MAGLSSWQLQICLIWLTTVIGICTECSNTEMYTLAVYPPADVNIVSGYLRSDSCEVLSSALSQYGKLIGSFSGESLHDVQGTIYAIDQSTLCVQGFSYDGSAPDATFYASRSDTPGEDGFVIPDENGKSTRLPLYANENLILHLTPGTTLENIKWVSIYCALVGADFGSIAIPADFVFPAPKSIGELGFTPRVHGVHADDVIILNTKQIRFINLVYDGFGPAAYFWTGSGRPDRNDERIPHPPGSSAILPRFDGEDVTITFPEDMSVTDVEFIGLWCVAARQNFGHLPIAASDLENIPPYMAPPVENCQVLLEDKFHISWTLGSDDVTLTFRGILDEGEYMAFGVSGSDSSTSMVGSDVTVAWIDEDSQEARAEDYNLNAYSQCIPSDGRGACPDTLQQNGVDNVELVSGKVRDGVTVIVVRRPISSSDPNDRPIPVTGSVPVSWGLGYINPTGHVAKHHTRPSGTVTVNFGGSGTCPDLVAPAVTPEPVDPWVIEPLFPANNSVLTAHIGPAGGRRGYQGITGQVGWGIAWYINHTVIPEIYVERGNTYTFWVYGGDDPSFLGTYHPFYISDSRDGGYEQKMPSEKQDENIYAEPIEGPLCEYLGDENPEEYATFTEYKATLDLSCLADAQPGVLTWTVAEDTPDTVYYQCYQHRFFGWEIHVRDTPPTTPEPTPEPTDTRTPQSSTPAVQLSTEEAFRPWDVKPLRPVNNDVMTAHLGPDVGRRGNRGIAGEPGQTMAWYINGTAIPEIYVERGCSYTFRVYGGDEVSPSGKYHPFYISASPEGGYGQKAIPASEKVGEKIYAGPIEGALCEYSSDQDPEKFKTFDEYKETLTLDCPADAEPGILEWTVADDTPDTVYYQSYHQRFLGWKIHVSNGCGAVVFSAWITLLAVTVGLFF